MSNLPAFSFSSVFIQQPAFGGADTHDALFDVQFDITDENGVTASIKAHKTLLAFVSPVFKRQFFGDMRNTGIEIEIVEVQDFQFKTFKELLKFIYTGDKMFIEKCNEFEDLLELRKLADKYMILDVVRLVEHRVRMVHLSKTNALPALEIAERYKNLLSFENICDVLSKRCVETLEKSWSSPTDVVRFWNENQDNQDLVNIVLSRLGKEHAKDPPMASPVCHNCKETDCLDGKAVPKVVKVINVKYKPSALYHSELSCDTISVQFPQNCYYGNERPRTYLNNANIDVTVSAFNTMVYDCKSQS